jgi:hypothetical protein
MSATIGLFHRLISSRKMPTLAVKKEKKKAPIPMDADCGE